MQIQNVVLETNLIKARMMPQEHRHIGNDRLLIRRSACYICGRNEKPFLLFHKESIVFLKSYLLTPHSTYCMGAIKKKTDTLQKDITLLWVKLI